MPAGATKVVPLFVAIGQLLDSGAEVVRHRRIHRTACANTVPEHTLQNASIDEFFGGI